MMRTCIPGPVLRPFVKLLWASDAAPAAPGARELVLPNGMMHLALRLSETPLRVFDGVVDAECARSLGTAVIGGARASFYVRDVSRPVCGVGAQLQPGAASLFLGMPAEQLAGQHTPLAALWGGAVERMRAQLAEAPSLEARLAMFERLLLARLPRIRGLHPAVAEGLMRLSTGEDVAGAVAASGYSHRRFTALFREAVGLAPKLYCRVRRFERALDQACRSPQTSWSALALAAGYSDQAHFNRDFREFSGLTPGRYRALSPSFAHHVPLPVTGP
jgi:AraC-like DNA-binding protein